MSREMQPERQFVQFPDPFLGWCSSCDLTVNSAEPDKEGRYCCEHCGDHLIFNGEELIDGIAEAQRALDAKDKEIATLRGYLVRIKSGVNLMVPEPQKSGFIKIIDNALSDTEG